jgi:hypothetical protein
MSTITEREIQAAGADEAPRIQPSDIEALHRSLQVLTHQFPGTTLTVAVAALPDGFVVGTGYSKPSSPANFDANIGATIAKGNALAAARDKLWELEGYLLRDRLRAAR